MKKLLITGSNGFLAKKLINRLSLEKKNYKITHIDKLKNSFISNKNRENFIQIDLAKKNELNKLKKFNFNYIIHTAAIQPLEYKKDNQDFFDGNILSTFNLIEMFGQKVEKIIFCSSFSVYGLKKKSKNIKETDEINPRNFYGLTKKICEDLLLFFSKIYNYNLIILRFDGIFGKGQNLPGYINFCKNTLIKNKTFEIFNKGLIKRDHVYVDDAVQAIIKSLGIKSRQNFIFNVGGGCPTSQKDISEYIKKKLNSKARLILSKKINKNFSKDVYLDITKIKKILKFKPKNIFKNVDNFLSD